MGINKVSSGDRTPHPSPESCDTYHGKCTMGPVRNLKPDQSSTLETVSCDTIKATRSPPEVSIRAVRHPGTPRVSQSRPRPRHDASPEPADIPLPPPALTALRISSPAQRCRVFFPSGGGSPAGPLYGLRPSPLTGRPRGVQGGGLSRENQACGAKTGCATGAWRLRPTGGVNDRTGRGLPAVTRPGGRDHSKRGGALAVVSPEEMGRVYQNETSLAVAREWGGAAAGGVGP